MLRLKDIVTDILKLARKSVPSAGILVILGLEQIYIDSRL